MDWGVPDRHEVPQGTFCIIPSRTPEVCFYHFHLIYYRWSRNNRAHQKGDSNYLRLFFVSLGKHFILFNLFLVIS